MQMHSASGTANDFRRKQSGSERQKGPQGDNHYPWGHMLDPKKANYGQQVGRTTPVDSYPDGVSGFGVYNMAGNVFEWVEDWYDLKYYKESLP